MTRIKKILDLVLEWRSSQKSSLQSGPRVALRRLSPETIKKYTGIQDGFESSRENASPVKSSPRKVSSSSVVSSLQHEPEKDDYENFAVVLSENEDSDDSSTIKENDTIEQEGEDQDTSSFSSSDELPDLINLTWSSKEGKQKGKKLQKKKEINVPRKTDAKLMKSARKAFQDQAVRYKSSQEFIKTTKVSKETQQTELRSPCPEDHSSHNDQLNIGSPKLSSTESHLLNMGSTLSVTNDTTVQGEKKTGNIESAVELSVRSELFSLNLKESLARYDRHKKTSVSENVSGVEAVSGEDSDQSQDSNSSRSTVYFDSHGIEDIYTNGSSHATSEEASGDNENVVSPADEANNSRKRKDSPSQEKSNETNKRQKQDDRQEEATELNENKQPMVMLPFSISCPVSIPPLITTNAKPGTVTRMVQVPLKTLRSTLDSSNAPSQASDEVEEGNQENMGKEDSDLPCKISSVSSVAVENIVNTHGKVLHPSSVPQDEFVLIDISSSQENGDSSGENVRAITPEPVGDSGLFLKVSNVTSLSSSANTLITDSTSKETNREGSTNTSKEVVTGTVNEETEDQQAKTNSISKESATGYQENALRSLKELSLQFHELTTKRMECDKKIRDLKEEYNKKLEIMEEEKKNFDIAINKMIEAMSKREELDKKQEPEKQQELAVSDASATATTTTSNAVVQQPEVTHGNVPATGLHKKNNPEKMHINIIADANVENFGKKDLQMQARDVGQLTAALCKQTKKSEKITNDTSLRFFRYNLAHQVSQAATVSTAHPSLSVVQTAVNPLHFQEKQSPSIASQAAATSLSSSSGSGDSSTKSLQLRPDVLHYSTFDKQPPPNAVVLPGQQHPVVTSSHIVCAAPPRPTTHTTQRCGPMGQGKPMSSNNPGLLPSGHKNPLSSQTQNLYQVQQKSQFVPVQDFLQQQQPQLFQLLHKTAPQNQIRPTLQQQHQQQAQLQLPNKSIIMQQLKQKKQQHMTGQLQNNLTQGQVIPAIFSVPESSSGVNCTTVQAASSLTPSAVIGSNNSTTVAINRMAVSHSQVENSLTTGSNIQKTAYIPVVGSVNLNHLQMQPVNVVTDKRRIGGASSSSLVSGATTANTYQLTAESQTDKSSHTADNTSEESEPVCVMCKAPGIFMCCNNVIYCNTTCQGKDWASHQHICTNTSSPDSS